MLRINSGSFHKHTKYIIIGFIVWCISGVTGLLCYRSAYTKASQANPEVIRKLIATGVSAIRSLALQNRFPVYIRPPAKLKELTAQKFSDIHNENIHGLS
jgi:hypothetical protein